MVRWSITPFAQLVAIVGSGGLLLWLGIRAISEIEDSYAHACDRLASSDACAGLSSATDLLGLYVVFLALLVSLLVARVITRSKVRATATARSAPYALHQQVAEELREGLA